MFGEILGRQIDLIRPETTYDFLVLNLFYKVALKELIKSSEGRYLV